MTFTGPQIAEPLQRRAPDFKELTGATINVVTVPFSDLYSKLLTDFATGTNSIDGMVFAPQWMVDYIEPGYLEDLTDRVNADAALQWDDVAPFFRDFSATYNGRIYTIPLDGDFQMVYYRSDLLDEAGLEPPKTWEDYLAIAKTFHGQDLNGDGEADYGSCIAKKRNAQSYWMVISVAGGFLQSQGTGQGAFFDTEDMSPLFNNEAFGKALDIYAETTKYGPPDEINLDVGDTRGLFTTGRCALSVDWGDIGTLAIDPATSKVQDKVGAVILPGLEPGARSRDRQAGRLRCRALPARGRWHQPRAVRGVRRLVGRGQRQQLRRGQGRGLRLLLVHEPARAGERGRDHRHHRLQSLPHLAVREPRPVAQGRDERGGGEELSGRHRRQPEQPEHGARSAHPAEPALRAGRARHRDRTACSPARSTREQAMADIETGWNEITEELGAEEQLEAYKATLGIRAE